MNLSDTLTMRGVIRLEIHRDGYPVDIWEEENLIVNAGKSNLARLLGDGGAGFLHQVQSKAEFNSTFWAAGAMIIAAFGGGRISLDRLMRKEF